MGRVRVVRRVGVVLVAVLGLSMLLPGPAAAATSPAHSFAAARTHTPTRTGVWVKDAVRSSRQQNWYRLVLTRRGYLSVNLGSLPKNYNLAVYNASGVRLGSSDRRGTTFETVDVPRASAGEYFVRVASTSGVSTVEYALVARLVTAPVGTLTAVRPGASDSIVGELVNTTDRWAVVGTIDVIYRNRSGATVRTELDRFTVGWFWIPPHSKMPFSTGNGGAVPKGTAGVTVVPNPTFAAHTPVRLSTKVVSREYLKRYGRWALTTAVKNTSTRRAKMVVVIVRGYDRRGMLVNISQSDDGGYAPDIAAGATVRISLTDEIQISRTSGGLRSLMTAESTWFS